MIAAIYARKSTDDSDRARVLVDEDSEAALGLNDLHPCYRQRARN
jgi:hypothetical protein